MQIWRTLLNYHNFLFDMLMLAFSRGKNMAFSLLMTQTGKLLSFGMGCDPVDFVAVFREMLDSALRMCYDYGRCVLKLSKYISGEKTNK